MTSKEILLKGRLLYVILDESVINRSSHDIFYLADRLSKWGVDLFQFRFTQHNDKKILETAKRLNGIIRKNRRILIINNRVDICRSCEAHGIHLGETDLPVKDARKILGKDGIIGKTIHSLDELLKTCEESIDYTSVGPVFKTKTKPELKPLTNKDLKTIMAHVKIPTFVIGGITPMNLEPLLENGIKNIAVCDSVIRSDQIEESIRKLRLCLKNHC